MLNKLCPIIIDIETSGFNTEKNTILEIALISIKYNKHGYIIPNKILHLHIIPFKMSKINIKALKCNKINLFHLFRFPIVEKEAIIHILEFLTNASKELNCKKCILIGHNSWFDLSFFNNLISRTKKTNNYHHNFTTIDTATLGNALYKQSILSKIAKNININFDNKKNHSAIYDAKITTLVFCKIMNKILKI